MGSSTRARPESAPLGEAMSDLPPAAGAEAPAEAAAAGEVERPAAPTGTRLASGVALTLDEANALAGESGASIVLPLGPKDVGKTTLMVELYERFLGGPWGG